VTFPGTSDVITQKPDKGFLLMCYWRLTIADDEILMIFGMIKIDQKQFRQLCGASGHI
jgi:hypothetical protein